MGQVAVRVRQLPVPQRVGAEARVHQGKGRHQRFVVQVQVKTGQLVRHQQPLIDHGVAAQAAHVEEIRVVFGDAGFEYRVGDDLANDVQFALKSRPVRRAGRAFPHEELSDGGANRARVPANLGVVQWNVAPTQQGQALVGNHVLDVGNARSNRSAVLRQENHPDAVFPLAGQRYSLRRRCLAEERIGHLHQDSGPVAGVRIRTGRPTMAQVVKHL